MANGKQASAKRLKMAERAAQQKNLHFPDVSDAWLWHRNRNDGYITVPRTMPLVMQAIDALTKGQPAGQTLFALWCRSPDHAVISIESPAIHASEAGFAGERAIDTWRRRMKKLAELMFILHKAGPSGDFHYVLLLNPNWVMEFRRKKFNDIPESIYSQFIERTMDVGAHGEIEEIRGNLARWEEEEKVAKAAAVVVPPAPAPPPPPSLAESDAATQTTTKPADAAVSVPSPAEAS
jgi:hypothetical protein